MSVRPVRTFLRPRTSWPRRRLQQRVCRTAMDLLVALTRTVGSKHRAARATRKASRQLAADSRNKVKAKANSYRRTRTKEKVARCLDLDLRSRNCRAALRSALDGSLDAVNAWSHPKLFLDTRAVDVSRTYRPPWRARSTICCEYAAALRTLAAENYRPHQCRKIEGCFSPLAFWWVTNVCRTKTGCVIVCSRSSARNADF